LANCYDLKGAITAAGTSHKYILETTKPEILLNNAIVMSAAPSDYDPEKNLTLPSSGGGSTDRNDFAPGHAESKGSWGTRFIDSFKRDPNAHVTKPAQTTNPREYDHAAAAERTANSGLATKLKGRHLQMIAIGGSIGSSQLLK
jgi:yeast amino acid transporter